MVKKIALIVLGVFIIFFGLGMFDLGLTDPEMSSDTASQVIAFVLGTLMILGGGVLVTFQVIAIRKIRGKKETIAKELRSDFCPDFFKITEDKNATEKLLREFRNDYAAFFSHHGVLENDAIQKDATQLYWHILSLQKNRLDQKGLSLAISSERLGYGGIAPVRQHKYFDGKYQIKEVSETIQAQEDFSNTAGQKIHTRKCVESAQYRILSAKTNASEQVVCPNCGNASVRENLIDGCDYCGTKFTIEDLNDRVSEFGFKRDCDVEYGKYKERRSKFIPLVALIVGIPSLIITLILSIKNTMSEDYGILIKIPGVMLASGLVTALIIVAAEIIFIVYGFPLIQGIASFRFMSAGMIKKMKKQESANKAVEKTIRKHDPLFSVNGFFSSLQNKLAVIHYARGTADASSFVESNTAEAQVASMIPFYQDVIDMQVDMVKLQGYQVGQYLQELSVTVKLLLLYEKNGSVSQKKETVKMVLVKDSNCKSQAVCAPAFTNCRQCGAPMSLLAGRTCQYCGYSRRLAEYDWAIRSYQAG